MKKLLIVLIVLLPSCSSRSTLDQSDSLKIIRAVLTSRDFYETLPRQFDTIYILKKKYYGISWPDSVNQVHIKYIPYTNDASIPNDSRPKIDIRMRYGFPVFNIKGDSANVVLYNFNFVIDMHYALRKQKNGDWYITKHFIGMR